VNDSCVVAGYRHRTRHRPWPIVRDQLTRRAVRVRRYRHRVTRPRPVGGPEYRFAVRAAIGEADSLTTEVSTTTSTYDPPVLDDDIRARLVERRRRVAAIASRTRAALGPQGQGRGGRHQQPLGGRPLGSNVAAPPGR
jgi:hypothetical protein